MLTTAPSVGEIMPAARAFRERAVQFLAAEAGIRQFLDVGTGLRGAQSTSEIAQAVDPACRIVCVDNDPMVLSHARALLRSTPEGAVDAVDADLSDPAAILAGAAKTLDFQQPVAMLVQSTLVFVRGTHSASAIVAALMAAASSGSYLALHHLASDLDPDLPVVVAQWNRVSAQQVTLRSRTEMTFLTAGLDLVEPGLVPVTDWRPAPDEPPRDHLVPVYAVVARKP